MKSKYNKICLAMLIIISASAFTSCKEDDDDEFAMSNQAFVNNASSSNNFEIAAGTMAVTKGQDDDVKHYGEHMVTDHSAAGVEMKALADREGWIVPAATDLMAKHKQNLDILAAASSSDFDKKFAQIMVESHQEAVNLFETASKARGIPDADLRAFATGKLPTLRAHLQEAIELKAAVD